MKKYTLQGKITKTFIGVFAAVILIVAMSIQQIAQTKNEEEIYRTWLFHYMKTGYGLNRVLKNKRGYLAEEVGYSVYMLQLNSTTILEYDSSSNMEMAQEGFISTVLKKTLKEMSEKYHLFDPDEGNWTILISGENGVPQEEKARHLIDCMYRETGFHFNVCFSSTGQKLEELPLLYEEVIRENWKAFMRCAIR